MSVNQILRQYNLFYKPKFTINTVKALARRYKTSIKDVFKVMIKRIRRKRNKLNIVKVKIPKKEIDDVSVVKRAIRDNGFKGKIRVLWYVDGKIKQDVEYNIITSLKKWWNEEAVHDWLIGYTASSITVFRYQEDRIFKKTGKKPKQSLIIMRPTRLSARRIYQYFADGVSHCVFTPILIWAQNKYDECESRNSKRKYTTILNKLGRYIKKYSNGIGEDDLKIVCNDLKVDICIYDVFKNIYQKAKSEKKSIKKFNYINTRENHVDFNELVCTNNVIELSSSDELEEIKQELNESGRFFTYNKYEVHCSDGVYKVIDPMMKTINEFEKSQGLDKLKIDGVKNTELSEFIKSGNHVSGCVDFNLIEEEQHDPIFDEMIKVKKREWIPDKHIDQIKSYTQFKNCEWYQGFPSKITDFRKVDCIDKREFLNDHIGYFKICNIKNVDCSVYDIIKKLDIYNIDCVLPSVECLFLLDIGFDFTIEYGCWSSQSIKFDFPEYMSEKNSDGNSLYSVWTGMVSRIDSNRSFRFKCTEEMGAHLQSTYPQLTYWDNECKVNFEKKSHYHLAHICGFIYSYSRMNVLSQLFEMKCDDIARVVVDGIYYRGDVNIHSTFREKLAYIPKNISHTRFMNIYSYDNPVLTPYRKNNHYEANIGPGGSGKTYRNLNDKGFVDLLYVAPSWKLSRSKINEFGCKGTVKARLLGEGCQYWFNPSVIIIDEATMWTEDDKNKVMSLYPYSKIIFCGDFSINGWVYQLPPVNGKAMSLDMPIINSKINRRCKCPKLRKILNKMRHYIDLKYSASTTKQLLDKYMKKHNRLVDNIQELYAIEDYILCSRRACYKCKKYQCDCSDSRNYVGEWTKLFKGKFDKEKYLITRNTKDTSNGDIVVSALKQKGAEIRHAFTIHAIQGETCKTKLFIDPRGLFDSRMAYTALSRAVRLSDIYYII